jgi:hypothetical protein
MIDFFRENFVYLLKVAILIVPIIIWEIFFSVISLFYQCCVWIDEKGGKIIENFMGKTHG